MATIKELKDIEKLKKLNKELKHIIAEDRALLLEQVPEKKRSYTEFLLRNIEVDCMKLGIVKLTFVNEIDKTWRCKDED